jgi:hypothetical protein
MGTYGIFQPDLTQDPVTFVLFPTGVPTWKHVLETQGPLDTSVSGWRNIPYVHIVPSSYVVEAKISLLDTKA